MIVNQAVNYLTIGLANAFNKKFDNVSLVTGSIHIQGEELNQNIDIVKIIRWHESPVIKKISTYFIATIQIYFLLLTKFRKFDILFVSLPPWAYLMNLFLHNRFSMLIWDVYPDTLKITGMSERHFVYKIWTWLNKKSFKKAYKLYTIGSKTSELLSQYVNSSKIIITPIWSIFNEHDKIEKKENFFIKEHNIEGKFIVQYSGNIGYTHNIEYLLSIADKFRGNSNIIFQIIGRGPKFSNVKKLIEDKSLNNCIILPFQSDEMFQYSLSAVDIGVVILDDSVAMGSVPSKSYNLMSFGIPSLYITSSSSELHKYAEKFKHAECFTKEDIDKSVDFIEILSKDKEKYLFYSNNALEASKNFKRANADKIVEYYLN